MFTLLFQSSLLFGVCSPTSATRSRELHLIDPFDTWWRGGGLTRQARVCIMHSGLGNTDKSVRILYPGSWGFLFYGFICSSADLKDNCGTDLASGENSNKYR